MHPPRFLQTHLLSDWPNCTLEMRCRGCGGRNSVCSVKGLMRWYGDHPFAEIVTRLRCKYCRKKPASVHLWASCQSDGEELRGQDWSIQILSVTEAPKRG